MVEVLLAMYVVANRRARFQLWRRPPRHSLPPEHGRSPRRHNADGFGTEIVDRGGRSMYAAAAQPKLALCVAWASWV